MKMYIRLAAMALIASLSLTACGSNNAPAPAAQAVPAPIQQAAQEMVPPEAQQVVQQAQSNGVGLGTAAVIGAGAYMLGRHNGKKVGAAQAMSVPQAVPYGNYGAPVARRVVHVYRRPVVRRVVHVYHH